MAKSPNGKWDASISYVGTLWNGNYVPGAIKRAIKEVPEFAHPILYKNSPVKTGYLRTHWNVSTGDRTLVITNPAYYAGFVDLGTIKIKPRYYVQKSLDEIIPEFKARATKYLLEGNNGATPDKRQRDALNRLSKALPIAPKRRPIIKYF
jgi:hypothetical protein